MTRNRPTTIRLPSDLFERIDALARAEVRTRQAQIERLIREALVARERAEASHGR